MPAMNFARLAAAALLAAVEWMMDRLSALRAEYQEIAERIGQRLQRERPG